VWEKNIGGNTPTIAEGTNVNAVSRERCESHTTMHKNKCPKGQSNRVPRSGGIAIFFDFDPPSEGGQKSRKAGPNGLNPLQQYQ